jgi:tetratricopeptide (TPR) repeat protein
MAMEEDGAPADGLAGSLYMEVSLLVEQQLFGSAVVLGQFMLAAAGADSAPPACALLFADALYGAQEWRRAAQYYTRAAQQQARLSGGGGGGDGGGDGTADAVDVAAAQVRAAQCHLQLGEPEAARHVLQRIAEAGRPVGAWLMLARLYSAGGSVELAVRCYKEVVRQNPYAVEATLALTRLREGSGAPVEPPAPALAGTAAGVVHELSNAHAAVVHDAVVEAMSRFQDLHRSVGRPTVHGLVEIAKLHAELQDRAAVRAST